MGSKIKTSRMLFFGSVVALLLALCVGALYQLQILNGAAYYDESQGRQVSNEVVTAARGNIYDRYGRVLVSNRECYNIHVNTSRLFNEDVFEDPNATILEMVRIVEAAGADWTDDLPITKEPPFEYDPDMSSTQRTLLEAYFVRHGLDEDTTAVELMSYFRTRYEIDNSYSAEEMRKISAVRYALNVRYAINTNDYIFVEDASIDLISELMGVVGSAVEVRNSYVREYATDYAAHVLGYVGPMEDWEIEEYMRGENSGYSYDTKVGKMGAELSFESWLHGSDGLAKVTRNSDGTVIGTFYETDPVPGNHAYITLDIQLQEAVEARPGKRDNRPAAGPRPEERRGHCKRRAGRGQGGHPGRRGRRCRGGFRRAAGHSQLPQLQRLHRDRGLQRIPERGKRPALQPRYERCLRPPAPPSSPARPSPRSART